MAQGLRAGGQAFEVGKKASFLLPVQLVHGVVVGSQPGDGQVVAPGHALLLAELNQAENSLVAVVVRGEEGGVKGQVVGGAVGDQGLAVAVGDDAPGGLHRFRPGDGPDGLRGVLLMVNDLNAV